jgi:hypothetical protein
MIQQRKASVPECSAPQVDVRIVARKLAALVVAGWLLATVTGCAQNPSRDRDLNAEAIQQMGYWGNDPGY